MGAGGAGEEKEEVFQDAKVIEILAKKFFSGKVHN